MIPKYSSEQNNQTLSILNKCLFLLCFIHCLIATLATVPATAKTIHGCPKQLVDFDSPYCKKITFEPLPNMPNYETTCYNKAASKFCSEDCPPGEEIDWDSCVCEAIICKDREHLHEYKGKEVCRKVIKADYYNVKLFIT